MLGFAAPGRDANAVYASGQSDDQLMEKALKIYEVDYSDGPFMLRHCWVILRDEPKFQPYLNKNKRKLDIDKDLGDHIDVRGDKAEVRPIGNSLLETRLQRHSAMSKSKGRPSIVPQERLLMVLMTFTAPYGTSS